ncbi:MAG: hypothetical protein WD336_04750 [Trueperaceae bacterium]
MTWDWLVQVAAWTFLAGVVLVTLSAFPVARRRAGRLMGTGFLLALLSLVLVLAAWGVPRWFGASP